MFFILILCNWNVGYHHQDHKINSMQEEVTQETRFRVKKAIVDHNQDLVAAQHHSPLLHHQDLEKIGKSAFMRSISKYWMNLCFQVSTFGVNKNCIYLLLRFLFICNTTFIVCSRIRCFMLIGDRVLQYWYCRCQIVHLAIICNT